MTDERKSHWDTDETYLVRDWKYEVANDDTRLGYAEWVEHQREADQESHTKHPRVHLEVTTLKEAHMFLAYLYAHGLAYHCEDDAEDCLKGVVSVDDARAINARMEECYAQTWPEGMCPCGAVLEMMKFHNVMENGKGYMREA